jgi:hypothetical protein
VAKRLFSQKEWYDAWVTLYHNEQGKAREKFIPLFAEVVDKRPDLFWTFEKFAFDAIRAGRERFSADMIFNRMRWYTQIETCDDSGFRLNNNYRTLLARLFMILHPEHDGWFEIREQGEHP